MTTPARCLRHRVWMASCPVCTAHHMARLRAALADLVQETAR